MWSQSLGGSIFRDIAGYVSIDLGTIRARGRRGGGRKFAATITEAARVDGQVDVPFRQVYVAVIGVEVMVCILDFPSRFRLEGWWGMQALMAVSSFGGSLPQMAPSDGVRSAFADNMVT